MTERKPEWNVATHGAPPEGAEDAYVIVPAPAEAPPVGVRQVKPSDDEPEKASDEPEKRPAKAK